MASIIDELRKRATKAKDSSQVVVFFFCNRGAEVTRKAENILNHLLSQIYAQFNNSSTETLDKANKLVAQRLGDTSKDNSGKVSDNAGFADVFRGLVGLLDRPVFAVIDALDECTDRSVGFVETLSAMAGVDSSCPGPKIVVCSRPEHDIQQALGRVSTIAVEKNNGPDIKLNAERQLLGLSGWSAYERQLACEKIVKQAGSYFRYVDLALDFLKQPWQRPLAPHLDQLPEGVNAFYEQTIQKTPPAYSELLRYSLTWTILGGRSVRVPEVIDAYSRTYATAESAEYEVSEGFGEVVEEENDNNGEEPTPDLQIQQIQVAGANLLLVDPKSLAITQRHSTVSDYFLSRNGVDEEAGVQPGPRCVDCEKSLVTNKRFVVSEKSGHLLIATTILRHLMNERFRQKYLVPHETLLVEETVSAEPNEGVNDAIKGSEEQVAATPENKPGNIEQSEQEMAAEQTSKETGADPDLEPGIAIVGVDQIDLKPDAPYLVAEQTTDLASEIGTVADSDVDQLDPMDWNFNGTLGEEHRYEINYLHYHLTKVEELWQPEDRQGSAWDEFEALRDEFFRDDSVFFGSWKRMLRKVLLQWVWPSQAFHCAARLGLTSLVERLIAKGTNISQLDGGDSALDFAIQYYSQAREEPISNANCLRLFEILLRAGVDINMRGDKDDMKFLSFRLLLVQDPGIDAVELFLKYGGDANAVNDGYGISVLHNCVSFSEKPEVLKAILDAGANPNAKDESGETPLHFLLQRREVPEEFVRQLLAAGANVNEEDLASQRPLYELCNASGNVDIAKLLVEQGADVTDDDVNGQTALHLACQNGRKDLVVYLIQHGAKIDKLDAENRTPFFLSCCAESEETALHLIGELNGSDVEVLKIASKQGKTPLRKAAAKGHATIVQALYEKLGSDNSILNEQDAKYQQTALHVAARNGRKKVVEYLLLNKAATNLKDKFGRIPLAVCLLSEWAPTSSGDHQAVCNLLLDASDDNAVENGILPGAAMKGNLSILQKMLDRGADPNLPDEHGWTAIQIAKQYGNMDAVELLLSRNVSKALRPTRLRLSKRHDSSDKSGLTATDCLAIADHPIPGDSAGFYYEIRIEESPEVASLAATSGWVMRSANLGICAYHSPKRRDWAPGNSPYRSWGWDGVSGLQITYPSREERKFRLSNGRFGTGDVVGCGLDIARQALFYTKNGELWVKTKADGFETHYAFTGLSGRLYPVVLPFNGASVEVNFGNDKEKPFVWVPGNEQDAGVSHIAREEEGLRARHLSCVSTV